MKFEVFSLVRRQPRELKVQLKKNSNKIRLDHVNWYFIEATAFCYLIILIRILTCTFDRNFLSRHCFANQQSVYGLLSEKDNVAIVWNISRNTLGENEWTCQVLMHICNIATSSQPFVSSSYRQKYFIYSVFVCYFMRTKVKMKVRNTITMCYSNSDVFWCFVSLGSSWVTHDS